MVYILPYSDLFLSQDLILSQGRCSIYINAIHSRIHLFHAKIAPDIFFRCILAYLVHGVIRWCLITCVISSFCNSQTQWSQAYVKECDIKLNCTEQQLPLQLVLALRSLARRGRARQWGKQSLLGRSGHRLRAKLGLALISPKQRKKVITPFCWQSALGTLCSSPTCRQPHWHDFFANACRTDTPPLASHLMQIMLSWIIIFVAGAAEAHRLAPCVAAGPAAAHRAGLHLAAQGRGSAPPASLGTCAAGAVPASCP